MTTGILERRAAETEKFEAETVRGAVEEARRRLVGREARYEGAVWRALRRAQAKLKELIAVAYAEDPEGWTNGKFVRTKRYEKLLAEVERTLDELLASWRANALAAAEDGWRRDWHTSHYILSETLGLDVDFVAVRPEQIKALEHMDIQGLPLSKRIKKMVRYTHRAIKDELESSLLLGRGVDETIRGITAATSIPRASAARIARVALMTAANDASYEVYKRNGIEYLERIETLDAKTCLPCGDADGRVYKIDEAPGLPAHFHCRGTYAPRARFGGKGMPKSRTAGRWREWLEGQQPEVQREVMGKARWAFWKAGVVDISDMHDGTGLIPLAKTAKIKAAVGAAVEKARKAVSE